METFFMLQCPNMGPNALFLRVLIMIVRLFSAVFVRKFGPLLKSIKV